MGVIRSHDAVICTHPGEFGEDIAIDILRDAPHVHHRRQILQHWHSLDSVPSPNRVEKYLCAGVPEAVYSDGPLRAKTEIPAFFNGASYGCSLGFDRQDRPSQQHIQH